MAYELEDPLAALTSSSARHSETDLELWKADSRVCEVASQRTSGDDMSGLDESEPGYTSLNESMSGLGEMEI